MPDRRRGGSAFCLRNCTTGTIVAPQARVARDFRSQLIGWMGRADIGMDEALGLTNCAAIHTFFVCVPLDAAFCDREGRVLRVTKNIAPFRIATGGRGAAMVWEMRAGGTLSSAVSVGDILTAAAERE